MRDVAAWAGSIGDPAEIDGPLPLDCSAIVYEQRRPIASFWVTETEVEAGITAERDIPGWLHNSIPFRNHRQRPTALGCR